MATLSETVRARAQRIVARRAAVGPRDGVGGIESWDILLYSVADSRPIAEDVFSWHTRVDRLVLERYLDGLLGRVGLLLLGPTAESLAGPLDADEHYFHVGVSAGS